MPPKKKDEEIDLSTLPPWMPVLCLLNYQLPKVRAAALTDILVNRPKDYQRNITRAEIINFAKEKGMYLDPTTINDKQKKDKAAADIPTVLTPQILAKAFQGFLFDLNIQGRKVR